MPRHCGHHCQDQRSPALPDTLTLCPLTTRIRHIRPTFGDYFGNPLVSCTDDHAHRCRLMLGIEDMLIGMTARLAARAVASRRAKMRRMIGPLAGRQSECQRLERLNAYARQRAASDFGS
jgi:hypothetical protein